MADTAVQQPTPAVVQSTQSSSLPQQQPSPQSPHRLPPAPSPVVSGTQFHHQPQRQPTHPHSPILPPAVVLPTVGTAPATLTGAATATAMPTPGGTLQQAANAQQHALAPGLMNTGMQSPGGGVDGLAGGSFALPVGATNFASVFGNNTLIKGRWKLVRKIGAGAFGEIFLARNVVNGEPVAIKMERVDSTKQVLRLEVAVLKKLQTCPFVVQFITCGRHNDYNYFVMSLLGKLPTFPCPCVLVVAHL